MHSWELVELAAYLASRGDLQQNRRLNVPSVALGEYWMVSKCRLDRWRRALRPTSPSAGRRKDNRSRSRIGGVCREVLIGEVLSRVWASVASAFDSFSGNCEAEPLATSVLNAHLEVTNRVLNLLSAGFSPISDLRSELNQLRRQAQRWTDLLLGRFGWAPGIAQFAHETGRAADFADDFVQSPHDDSSSASWRLLRTTLRATFQGAGDRTTACADLNARIAGAIFRCLPEELSGHAEGFDWLLRLRLSSAANDTEMLVAQLLETGAPTELSLSG